MGPVLVNIAGPQRIQASKGIILAPRDAYESPHGPKTAMVLFYNISLYCILQTVILILVLTVVGPVLVIMTVTLSPLHEVVKCCQVLVVDEFVNDNDIYATCTA